MASSIFSADGKKKSIIGLAKAAAGHVRRPEAHHRAVEPLERLPRHDGGDLSGERSRQVGLGDDQELASLFGRVEDGLLVQRIQRPRLDDLGLDTLLFGELAGPLGGPCRASGRRRPR